MPDVPARTSLRKNSRRRRGLGHPASEGLAALVGEGVDALLARVSGDVLAADEPVPLEALECRVHLPRVDGGERRAELELERLLQLVAVARPGGEECEERVLHK
jgi:hypothetical protein